MTEEVMSNFFLILAIVCVLCGVLFSIMITAFISKRGTKINYLLIRIYIYKYVNQYRKTTIEENGKVGPLFYPFIISFILALIFAIVGAILKITT
ncbi:hypothetical protein ACFLUS_01870 [Chloroflexota bacterium]